MSTPSQPPVPPAPPPLPPKEHRGLSRSAVGRGYVLAFALACASVLAVGLRLHREGRLESTVAALRHGDVLTVTDEVLSGRLGDAVRKHDWLALWVPALERFAATPEPAEPPPAPKDPEVAERPPPLDPQLSDPDRRLDSFFDALLARERGERDKVRMLYFGTSEIGHDRVTSQMRRHLQERFGDGGKGWVLIDRTWAILDHRDVIWRHDEPHWKSYSIRSGTLGHGHYGLGGVLVKSTGPAWAEYRTTVPGQTNAEGYHEFPSGTAWSHVEVHYQTFPRGAPFTIAVDNQPPETIQTESAAVSDGVWQAELEDGPHHLRIETESARTHMYGVVLERDRGLVLDALMVIGAWGDSITEYDPDHLTAQIDRREPALAVLQLGAKESLRHPELSPQQTREFVAGYQRAVEMVMAGRDQTACLIVSPKDQAYEVGGRVETRPAIPRLVAAAEEVARATGCAFYDLYEAMGGEGTARRWAVQQPRLVSSDLGHLTAPGSIRIGDMLTDLILGEYEAYRTWLEGSGDAALSLADTGGPATAAQQLAFAMVPEDPLEAPEPCARANKSVIDCRQPTDWIRTNERGHPLWAPHLAERGGGYVGVGADQSYDIIAAAGSDWAWIVNDDPILIAYHEILLALTRAFETPVELARALRPDNADATRELIATSLTTSRFSPEERAAISGTFDDARRELERYMRRSLRERPLFPEWGWLHVPEHYALIRSLALDGRIRTVRASLTGQSGLKGVAESARALGVPIRVVYLSNEESKHKRPPEALRDNLRALPFDKDTIVLRTVLDDDYSRDPDFSKWHYVLHEGLHLQELLAAPNYRGPESIMEDATLVDDCLSWIGVRGAAVAAGTETDPDGPDVSRLQ